MAVEKVSTGREAMNKVRNLAQYQAAMERRRSNAASAIPSGKAYRRKPKHADRQGW